MRQYKVANRYAKALFSLALETGQLEDVHKDIALIHGLNHPEFSRMMVSPVVNSDAKSKTFDAVFGGKISKLSQSFFNLVFRKGRFLSLNEIGQAFEDMYLDHKGVVVAELTTAVSVSESIKSEMRAKLEALPFLSGKSVILKEKVDPSIIGGYVLQIGGQSLDASIKRDLQVIKTQFVENMYVQKLR
jgi:F-type H+-transporting ATPase subunit delta